MEIEEFCRTLDPALSGDYRDGYLWSSGDAAKDLGHAARDALAVPHFPGDPVVVEGEDAAILLQGLLTSDVKSIGLGSASTSFLLNQRGGILAALTLLKRDAGFLLDADRKSLENAESTLKRFNIGVRAKVGRLAGFSSRLWVLGPKSQEIIGESLSIDLDRSPFHELGKESFLYVRKEKDWNVIAVVGTPKGVSEVYQSIAPKIPLGGMLAFRAITLRKGSYQMGFDYSENEFLLHLGTTDAVSFTKGCYLGQEAVSRGTLVGKIKQGLRTVTVASPVEVPSRASVFVQGEKIGETRGWVCLPDTGLGSGLIRLDVEKDTEIHFDWGSGRASGHLAT